MGTSTENGTNGIVKQRWTGNSHPQTGPLTPQGKAVTKMNAVKTGLFSQAPVVQGETQEQFNRHVQQVVDELDAQGRMETMFAHKIAWTWWRQMRLVRYEIAAQQATAERYWKAGLNAAFDAEKSAPDPELVQQLAVIPDSQRLEVIKTWEAHLERSMNRMMDQLERLQAKRKKRMKVRMTLEQEQEG